VPKRPGDNELYLILDGRGFAREVDLAVKRKRPAPGTRAFGGNETQAAKYAGIDQSQISRLRRRAPVRITRRTYDALLRIIAPPRREAFRETLLPPAARYDLECYHGWIQSERLRLAGVRDRGLLLDEEREREANRIKARIRRQLLSHGTAFDEAVRGWGHEPERLDLAWARIIAPLLDYFDSGGLECSVDDLTDDQFAELIKAGIRAQRVMLKRPTAIQRAQRRAHSYTRLAGRRRRTASAEAMQRLAEKILAWEHRWD